MTGYNLAYKETRLKILCNLDLRERALEKLIEVYRGIEETIERDPMFQVSYTPVKAAGESTKVVKEMAEAGEKAGVGPMAAVAGAVAEAVGRFLLENGADDVVIENGGDIFLKTAKERKVGIHAGPSRWSNRLALNVKPQETPLGICTSSASVGHSINLGDADAVTAVAKSAALADAAATAIANHVKGRGVEKAVNFGKKIKSLDGFIIMRGDELAAWGKLPEITEAGFSVNREP